MLEMLGLEHRGSPSPVSAAGPEKEKSAEVSTEKPDSAKDHSSVPPVTKPRKQSPNLGLRANHVLKGQGSPCPNTPPAIPEQELLSASSLCSGEFKVLLFFYFFIFFLRPVLL